MHYRRMLSGLIVAFIFASNLPAAPPKWVSLFDGKTLGKWKSTEFGGEGDIEVRDKQIIIGYGSSLSGITYKGEFPKNEYEIELEAQRLEGIDFFCCLTFPVGEDHCSFVVGGWAGAVVGLSSIDDKDASENATTRYMDLKDNRWYKIRVRVTTEKIETWIDDKQVASQKRKGHKISTRGEVDLSQPVGISTWETKGAVRNIRMRKLK